MSATPVYRALATTFTLEVDGEVEGDLGQVLREAHADLRVDDAGAAHVIGVSRRLGGRWRTSVDGSVRERRCDGSTALHDVRRAINSLALDSVSATHTVIGASAIRVGGAVVALFGNILSGKSTLAVAAARRGHAFIADDVLAVDAHGNAESFHRPVNVRVAEAERLGLVVPHGPFDHGMPVAMSRLTRLDQGGPLTLLVEVHRNDSTTEVLPLSPSTALMHLSSQALRVPDRHRPMFRRLTALARSVPAIELYHHDLDRALDVIESKVGAGSVG